MVCTGRENTLLRHASLLSSVRRIQRMFALSAAPHTPQESSSKEHPFTLESIKADELKEFLRVLSHSKDAVHY